VTDVATERAAALARRGDRDERQMLEARARRVLAGHWNESRDELLLVIGELYPKVNEEAREKLVAVCLELQATERPKIDPSTVRVAPLDLEKPPRKKALIRSMAVAELAPFGDDLVDEENEEEPLDTLEEIVAEVEDLDEVAVEEQTETVVFTSEIFAIREEIEVPKTLRAYDPKNAEDKAAVLKIRNRLAGHDALSEQSLMSAVEAELGVTLTKNQATHLRYSKAFIGGNSTNGSGPEPTEAPEAPIADEKPEPLRILVEEELFTAPNDIGPELELDPEYIRLEQESGGWRLGMNLLFQERAAAAAIVANVFSGLK